MSQTAPNLENYQLANFTQRNPTVRIIFYPINNSIEKEDAGNSTEIFLKEFQDLVEQHYHEDHFRAKQLAKMLHISESQLFRRLKTLTNQGFASYLRFYRLRKAKELIEQAKGLNISEIAYALGFTEATHFNNFFKKHTQLSPSKFRNL